MTTYLTVDIGYSNNELISLINNLNAYGINFDYLLTDIVECLRSSGCYNVEILCLRTEIEHGDYYFHKLQEEPLNVTRQILSELAHAVENAAMELFATIKSQGMYDSNNEFHYEFKSRHGRALLLKDRRL